MLSRFTGAEGRALLVEALAQQRIVQGERAIAEKLADAGALVEFAVGDTVVTQRGTDTDVFFIISGEATVFVNNREIGSRGAREVVGEMVAVDAAARRSATVKARSPLACLKVCAAAFVAAGEGSSVFWRSIAQMTGDRLRARERFHRPANPVPVMFVGSSVEGLQVVTEIDLALKHDKELVLHPWTRSVFGPSRIPLEDLLAEANRADFALFVFGPDDKVASRGSIDDAPRDNVIYEMGLFAGRLGRERVFMLREDKTDLKIPSDLTGIKPVTYVLKAGGSIGGAVATAVVEIQKAARELGAI